MGHALGSLEPKGVDGAVQDVAEAGLNTDPNQTIPGLEAMSMPDLEAMRTRPPSMSSSVDLPNAQELTSAKLGGIRSGVKRLSLQEDRSHLLAGSSLLASSPPLPEVPVASTGVLAQR